MRNAQGWHCRIPSPFKMTDTRIGRLPAKVQPEGLDNVSQLTLSSDGTAGSDALPRPVGFDSGSKAETTTRREIHRLHSSDVERTWGFPREKCRPIMPTTWRARCGAPCVERPVVSFAASRRQPGKRARWRIGRDALDPQSANRGRIVVRFRLCAGVPCRFVIGCPDLRAVLKRPGPRRMSA